jgi:hypothetical protein
MWIVAARGGGLNHSDPQVALPNDALRSMLKSQQNGLN